jgi:hypothetical protein
LIAAAAPVSSAILDWSRIVCPRWIVGRGEDALFLVVAPTVRCGLG